MKGIRNVVRVCKSWGSSSTEETWEQERLKIVGQLQIHLLCHLQSKDFQSPIDFHPKKSPEQTGWFYLRALSLQTLLNFLFFFLSRLFLFVPATLPEKASRAKGIKIIQMRQIFTDCSRRKSCNVQGFLFIKQRLLTALAISHETRYLSRKGAMVFGLKKISYFHLGLADIYV